MRRFLIFLAACLGLAAQSPDYFPLHVGNQWVYRVTGVAAGGPVVVDIPRSEVFDGRNYALVRGFAEGDAYLRMEADGTLYRYDAQTRSESVWAVFSTPVGGSYKTSINPCNQTARVESREATVTTPAGEFGNALTLSYPAANCADAGLTGEAYLPWIGLVQRTATTIAGPRTMSLAYARVGGVTVLSEPEASFSLALDRTQYSSGETAAAVLTARMTLRVTQGGPLALPFSSGQRFDLVISNDLGEVLLRWSEGRVFTQALGTERIDNGEKNYVVQMPLAQAGSRLKPGSYVAEGWLTTMDEPAGGKRYAARVGFDIIAVR
ncbi:MAG: hypothetical protein JJE04_03335 [Acidobacteriia bacterium]|nr:hypothetical protein [Terriglobia bacterium]